MTQFKSNYGPIFYSTFAHVIEINNKYYLIDYEKYKKSALNSLKVLTLKCRKPIKKYPKSVIKFRSHDVIPEQNKLACSWRDVGYTIIQS